MRVLDLVTKAFFSLRRAFKLTPVHSVMRSIRRHGVDLKSLKALDLFGGYGDMMLKDYAPYVGQLEIWEINPDCEAALRKKFPQATIRITDSYEEIKRTPEKFNMVVADTWTHIFNGHCEHFELFPDVFRVLSPVSILILNVIPEFRELSPEHAQRRRDFYHVEDPKKIPVEVMVERYRALAEENGFQVQWWFYRDRYFMYPLRRKWLKKRLGFLVLGLRRRNL